MVSKSELARTLNLARATVLKYLAMPGAPRPGKHRRYDRHEVAKWIAANGSANVEGSEMRGLRALKLRLETEALEHEMKAKRGETITKAEIAPAIAAFNTELTVNLRQKFEIELPQKYRGKKQVECQQINAEAVDFILKRLKDGQWALGINPAPPLPG